MAGDRDRSGRKRGRAEQALETTLMDRSDINRATRAALRVQAHALDLAEAAEDPELITTVNAGYLDLLQANGLTSDRPEPVDAFEQLLADLGRATASPSNTAEP
jgi:hypothetical protein